MVESNAPLDEEASPFFIQNKELAQKLASMAESLGMKPSGYYNAYAMRLSMAKDTEAGVLEIIFKREWDNVTTGVLPLTAPTNAITEMQFHTKEALPSFSIRRFGAQAWLVGLLFQRKMKKFQASGFTYLASAVRVGVLSSFIDNLGAYQVFFELSLQELSISSKAKLCLQQIPDDESVFKALIDSYVSLIQHLKSN